MNKMKMSLKQSLSGVRVPARLEDRILQGQFQKERKSLRLMPVAATVGACAILFWSVSLLPLFSSDNRDNPDPIDTTNTSTTTDPTLVKEPSFQMYLPTVENPPDRTLHGFGTLTGHLDWDEKPDTVSIYPDQATAGPDGYSQVIIEVTLGNGRTLSLISQDESRSIKNIVRADLFDMDNNDTDDLVILYEMDYDHHWAIPLRIITLEANALFETNVQGYNRFITFKANYRYSFPGLYGYEEQPVPQAIRDEIYDENGEFVNPVYGHSAVKRYELIEKDIGLKGEKSLRIYQDVWVGESRYPLGVGITQVLWGYSSNRVYHRDFQYYEAIFVPAETEATFPTAVLGTQPSGVPYSYAEEYNYEETIIRFLEGWRNKDLDKLNICFEKKGIWDLQYTEEMLQQIDISDYRYEQSGEDDRVYTVYLDIERSNLKGMPAGKNRKFSLVCDMTIEEFTLIDPAPIAPERGIPFNYNKCYQKNELYYNAFRLLSSSYIEIASGPIAIDMSKTPTKYYWPDTFSLVNIFPQLFIRERKREEPIPVDVFLEKFSKVCRIKNFDPTKIIGYSSSSNTILDPDTGVFHQPMSLTHVKQEGDVYICSFDLYDDPFCTVVTRSLDITMRDNGDGTYFFDRMDITYTCDIPIVAKRTVE